MLLQMISNSLCAGTVLSMHCASLQCHHVLAPFCPCTVRPSSAIMCWHRSVRALCVPPVPPCAGTVLSVHCASLQCHHVLAPFCPCTVRPSSAIMCWHHSVRAPCVPPVPFIIYYAASVPLSHVFISIIRITSIDSLSRLSQLCSRHR